MSYNSNPLIDNMIALRLLTMLCTPFNQFPAYKSGVIDEKGKYLIKSNKQTAAQKRTCTYLDRLIINVKKMINKLPGGESKLKNIVAAMVLIKESIDNNVPDYILTEQSLQNKVIQYNIANPQYQRMINLWCEYLKTKQQNEDVGVGAIGGGSGGNPPANNTSGIAITTLPLSQNSIVRRTEKCRLKRR